MIDEVVKNVFAYLCLWRVMWWEGLQEKETALG